MSGYPYSAEDRLAAPHKYMYTPYSGRPFLDAYFADRASLADPDGDPAAAALAALDARPSWGPPGTSAGFLEACVRAQLAGMAPGPALDDHLRRYEVAKKLHRQYDPVTRKGSGGYEDMVPYALLALACALERRRGGTLKYLNCLLKLGDLLVSRRAALEPEVSALARPALALETVLVRELMAGQGVQ
jgi:hypothetical protein